jgi:acetoin utilization protein AcuB
MLVRDVMQKSLVTVALRTTLPEAIRLMHDHGIRHLPVVEDGRLCGIVSDRDLKRAMASSATTLAEHELTYLLDRVRVGEIMTRTVLTTAPMFPVEEAARLMVRERISALPVTEGDTLVGIVTETDVLQLFVRALGAGEPSARLDIALGPGRTSSLPDVVETIEGAGAAIASVVTLPTRTGTKEIVIRVLTINPIPAIRALEAKGYAVRDSWRDSE